MKYLLVTFAILHLVGCNKEAAPTSYYFPNGFKGEFVIVYGQKNGCLKKYEKGRRQLFIPDNGVLITQFEFSDGFRNDLFYIQNEKGEYEPLKEFVNPPKKVLDDNWEMDTSKYTMSKIIRSIRRGSRAEVYNNRKEVCIIEAGAFMNEEESDALALTGNILSDAVSRQVEADSLAINCR